jgi:hypothetical protein
MGFDILNIFGFLTVYIAGDIQVIFIFFNLCKGNHPGILLNFQLFIEHINNPVNIHTAQAVFISVFHKAFTGINHKNALTACRMFFIKDNNTGRNTCAIKEVGR